MRDDDNITIDTSDMNTQEWDDWITQYLDEIEPPPAHLGSDNINLTAAGEDMLRISPDGFYVRGVRVEADAQEAEAVYKAFKQWMTYAILNGEINN